MWMFALGVVTGVGLTGFLLILLVLLEDTFDA